MIYNNKSAAIVALHDQFMELEKAVRNDELYQARFWAGRIHETSGMAIQLEAIEPLQRELEQMSEAEHNRFPAGRW